MRSKLWPLHATQNIQCMQCMQYLNSKQSNTQWIDEICLTTSGVRLTHTVSGSCKQACVPVLDAHLCSWTAVNEGDHLASWRSLHTRNTPRQTDTMCFCDRFCWFLGGFLCHAIQIFNPLMVSDQKQGLNESECWSVARHTHRKNEWWFYCLCQLDVEMLHDVALD